MGFLEGLRTGAGLVRQYQDGKIRDENQAFTRGERERERKAREAVEAAEQARIESEVAPVEQPGLRPQKAVEVGMPAPAPKIASTPLDEVRPNAPVSMPGALAPVPQTGDREIGIPAEASAMPKARTRGELEMQNDGLMAAAKAAYAKGQFAVGAKYLDSSRPLRVQLGQEAYARSRAEYEASQDMNAFVPFFNRYVANGIDVESIKEGSGEAGPMVRVAGKDYSGKPVSRDYSRDQMLKMVQFAADPRGRLALEAQFAESARKAETEAQLAERKAAAEKRFQSVKPGEVMIDTQRGTTFGVPDTKILKDENGTERLVRISPDGKVSDQGGGSVAMNKQAVSLTERANRFLSNDIEARSRNGQLLNKNDLANVETARTYIGKIAAANQDTDARLTDGELASTAMQLARGEIKVQMIKVPGIPDPVEGIVVGGRPILLDAFAVGQRSASPRGRTESRPPDLKPNSSGGLEPGLGRIPVSVQAGRDAAIPGLIANGKQGTTPTAARAQIADIDKALKDGKLDPAGREFLVRQKAGLMKLLESPSQAGLGTQSVTGQVVR
jgi:hypothetical protein